MDKKETTPDHPQPAPAEPVVLPDVATQAHPTGTEPLTPPVSQPEGGTQRLQGALPEINEAAKKVGGFRKLADIANELDQQGQSSPLAHRRRSRWLSSV